MKDQRQLIYRFTDLPIHRYVREIKFLSMLLCIILATACENDPEEVKRITDFTETPVESTYDAELFYSDSGKVELKLTAPVMHRYIGENPYLELDEGVHVWFYDDDMNVESELTAEYAIRYEGEQKMEARKNVVFTNVKGERLNTEHLIWDEKNEKIYSYEYATITTPDEVIVGRNGFEANQNFTKYTIYNTEGEFSNKQE